MTFMSFSLSSRLEWCKVTPVDTAGEFAMTASSSTDHRPRVAAERREKMRRRLVESAMLVFSEKGAGASVIQEVVAAAGVSNGTFYNYFRTNEELLTAVIEDLNNELMSIVEAVVGPIDDPACRLATGIRLYLHTAQAYPVFARFICGIKLQTVSPNNLIYTLLPPDIEEGMIKGRFVETAMPVALDLIAGTVIAAVTHIVAGVDEGYPESIAEVILRGLGADATEARNIVLTPLGPLDPPADSLLIRSNNRFSARDC